MGRMGTKPPPHQAALRELGSLEARVVTTMWDIGEGTVQDVLDRLNASNAKDLAYNTVMTVMARLADKGLLRRNRRGRAYRYEPAVDRQGLFEHQVATRFSEIIDAYGEVAWPVMVREARKAGIDNVAAEA